MNTEFESLLEKANAGDLSAMVKVGNALRNGNKRMSVDRNFKAGIEWLEKAANAGSAEAMKYLASAYHRKAISGAYFDFSASEKGDYWQEKLNAKNAEAKTRTDEVVLIGKGKKRIGSLAFSERSDLVRIKIAPTVMEIGCSAFANCKSLISVEFPDGLAKIENLAFCGCTSLERVVIPQNVSEIGADSFCNCSSIKTVELSGGQIQIGCGAFAGCSSLEDAKISGARVIDDGTFRDCASLRSVRLAGGVESINRSAFADCRNLKTLELPEGLKDICNSAFSGCENLDSVKLPQGLENIGICAFKGCSSLKEVSIPDSVEMVGAECFKDCRSLASVEAGPAVWIARDAFCGCESLPKELISGTTLLRVSSDAEEYVVPEGIETIGTWAFAGNNTIRRIVLPDSATVIRDGAFEECRALETVENTTNVKSLGQSAFACSTALKSAPDFPMVEVLNPDVYQRCTSLTNVHLSPVLKTIRREAFAHCVGLLEVDIPSGVREIEFEAFCGCRSLRKVILPEGLRKIESDAFKGCASIQDLTIPSSVIGIGKHAFCVNSGSGGLKKVCIRCGALRDWLPCEVFDGLNIEEAQLPEYIHPESGIFGATLPKKVVIVGEDGASKTYDPETPARKAYFLKYGISWFDVKYEAQKGFTGWAGCYMQSPDKSQTSVVVPDRYKESDPRKLSARIYTKGSQTWYDILDEDGKKIESYTLQRDAKKSKYWPVFEALIKHKSLRYDGSRA